MMNGAVQLSPPPANPVLVEVTRGPVVESLHRGAVAVCDAAGGVVAAWGDIDRAVFPRSAIKPIQALPLLETGAADHFALGSRQIALACASHSGQDMHVQLAGDWLARMDLSARDLECGAHAPINADAAQALVAAGQAPTPLHNNCSGKHCGFLTTARHLGEPTRGYIGFDHPVQRRVAAVLGDLTDCAMAQTPHGTDGCGIPTFALPLASIATAMARLADPSRLGTTRGDAIRRVRAAMGAHPELVAGSGRLCTQVMRAVPDVLVKVGAEGVYIAILPKLGLGVALKIDDGTGRAAEVALLAVLRHLRVFDAKQEQALRGRGAPSLLNVAGHPVGTVRPAASWLRT
jgi:L-asparaginase II